MRIPAPATLYALAATMIAGTGFAFVLEASYPGYLNADTVTHLEQIAARTYDDWQSPFPKLLWALLMAIVPGPLGFIMFANLLVWGASLGLTLALRARLGRPALLFLFLPLLPGTFNFLGNVNVDTLLAGWLMAGVCAAYVARRQDLPIRARRIAQALANLFLVAAVLTRPNAIFAIVPLLLYANARFGLRRNLALCAALLVALPVLVKTQNALIGAESTSPGDSIKVYNLLALSHYEERNLFPGRWTVEQARQIVYGCYSPMQWDTAWSGQCSFIFWQLKEQGLWGSSDLTRRWLREIVRHPLSYFSILSANFKRSLLAPNAPAMLYKSPNRWDWEVDDDPPRPATELAQDYIRSDLNDRLSRPALFVLVTALGLVLLLRKRMGAVEEGRLAFAVFASGLVYLLTYFPFNVSSEYRYFYWSAFATYLGVLVLALAWLKGAPPAESSPAAPEHELVRRGVLALAALAAALASFPFQAPVERRVVTVTPKDGRSVVVLGVRSAATPKWIRPQFEGRIDAPAWTFPDMAYRSTRPHSPLVAELQMLRQDIEIVLATGPGLGLAAVESKAFEHWVDTHRPDWGVTAVIVPAPPIPAEEVLAVTLRNLGNASLLFLLFLAVLAKAATPPAAPREAAS